MQLSEANPGTRTPVRPPKRNGTEIGDAAGGSSGHSDEVDCQPSTEITSGSSENWMVLSIAGDKPTPRSNVSLSVFFSATAAIITCVFQGKITELLLFIVNYV